MKSLSVLLASCFAACFAACAQNFAVLVAKDDPGSPIGFPANWPVKVQPIGSLTNLPVKFPPPWQFMTGSQLTALKASNESEKEAWNKQMEDAPRIAAEQAKAAEKSRIDGTISEVEVGLKEWQSADEKAKGDILLKLLHVILEALRQLGADVKQVDKPSEITAPK